MKCTCLFLCIFSMWVSDVDICVDTSLRGKSSVNFIDPVLFDKVKEKII